MPTDTYLSPPAIAKALAVSPDKVRGWIERGELVAVNLAANRAQRPRYRVAARAVQEFLARREVQPRMKSKRRSERQSAAFIRYY